MKPITFDTVLLLAALLCVAFEFFSFSIPKRGATPPARYVPKWGWLAFGLFVCSILYLRGF